MTSDPLDTSVPLSCSSVRRDHVRGEQRARLEQQVWLAASGGRPGQARSWLDTCLDGREDGLHEVGQVVGALEHRHLHMTKAQHPPTRADRSVSLRWCGSEVGGGLAGPHLLAQARGARLLAGDGLSGHGVGAEGAEAGRRREVDRGVGVHALGQDLGLLLESGKGEKEGKGKETGKRGVRGGRAGRRRPGCVWCTLEELVTVTLPMKVTPELSHTSPAMSIQL